MLRQSNLRHYALVKWIEIYSQSTQKFNFGKESFMKNKT